MNTSKSLDSIVANHHNMLKVLVLAESQGMTHKGSEKVVIDDFKQAIVEAVEGLVGKATHYTTKPYGSYIDQDELRQAIKEWQ